MAPSLAMTGKTVSHYRVLDELGGGGMGIVYKAEDLNLGRTVALKFLSPQLTRDGEAKRRFFQEARAASILDHPNICTVHEAGETEDGSTWIALAYYEGETLRKTIAEGPQNVRKAVSIIRQIAEGLAAAHAAGIVHRDIKPANVIVTPQGVAKIVDFGLAKLVGCDITRPLTSIGTVTYMAPEQILGGETTPATDFFALGLVFFELLTGRRVYEGTAEQAIIYSTLNVAPPSVRAHRPEIPEEIERIVAKLLRKEPAYRYQTAAELILDLDAAVSRSQPKISDTERTAIRHSDSAYIHAHRLLQYRPALAQVLAVLTVLLIAAVTITVVREHSAAAPSAQMPEKKQLAVLPFTDLSGNADNQRLAAGLSESLAARLSSLSTMQVFTPAAAGESELRADMKTLASELGANLILRGSLLHDEERVRVTYAIVDPRTGIQLAANAVNGSRGDLFALEDHLAETVLASLSEKPLKTAPPRIRIASGAAQDHYFQAMGYLQRYDDPASVNAAVGILDSLHASAGESALISAALGRAYLYKFQLTHDAEDAKRAQSMCDEALRIDSRIPEPHITTGEIATRTGRFTDAIAAFRRALAIKPSSSAATLGLAQALDRASNTTEAEKTYRAAIAMRPDFWGGYNKLGVFYVIRGRFGEAVPVLRKAADLNPDSPRPLDNLGAALMGNGNYEQATAAFEKSIKLRPTVGAYSNLGTCSYIAGNFANAVRAYEEATRLDSANYVAWFNLGDGYRWAGGQEAKSIGAYAKAIEIARAEAKVNPNDALLTPTIAMATARSGDPATAEKILSPVRRSTPKDPQVLFASAVVRNLSGNQASAIEYLKKAEANGYPTPLIVAEPEFANLRKDPWFATLHR